MFLALIFLGVTSALDSFFDIEYGDTFGPLKVSWPNSWVVSRFEANSNYLGSATTIYFYFSVDSNEVLTGYYAGIKMPSDTSFTSCTLSYLSEEDNDWKATCTYTVSTDLVYGPINFVLAKSTNGEIVAQDAVAGFLAFLEGSAPSADTTLTVTYKDESDTTKHIVSGSESLTFSFALSADNSLYPGDYFILTLESDFKYGTPTVAMDTTLESSKAFPEPSVYYVNSDNGTPLVTTDDYINKVYIYGCVDEIEGGSTITFTLDSVTNPSIVTTGGSYSWSLEVWRYGTNTKIALYTATGPSTSVTYGGVTVSDWSALTSSAIDKSANVLRSLEAYFSLTFKFDHDVPASGTIVVDYTGATINDYDLVTDDLQVKDAYSSNYMVFVSTSGSASLTCTLTSEIKATITVGSTAALTAGSTVTLINYLKVGSSASTVTAAIQSKSGTAVVDQLATASSLTVQTSASNVLLSNPKVYVTTAKDSITEITKVNTAGLHGLVVIFKSPVALAIGDAIDIYLPFSTGEASVQKNLAMKSGLWGTAIGYSSVTGFATGTVAASTAGTVSSASSGGKISFTLTAAITNIEEIILYIGSGSSTTSQNLYTPLVSLLEPTEVVLKFTKSSVNYYGTSILSFKTQSFTTAPTVEFLCKNLLVDGSPVKVTYTPVAWTYITGATVKVNFKFYDGSTAMDLFTDMGLTAGDAYPSTNTNLKVASDGTLYISVTASLTATAVSFYVPINTVTSGSSAKIDVYISVSLRSSDKSFNIYSASSIASTVSTATTASSADNGAPTAGALTTKINAVEEATITLKDATAKDINADSSSAAASYSSILILPAGYSTSDTDIVGTSLASSDSDFPFRVYFKENAGTISEAAGAVTSRLSITPNWEIYTADDTTKYTFAYAFATTLSAASCITLSGNLVISAQTITVSGYSPSSTTSYLYNSRKVSVALTFVPQNIIYSGSLITIVLDGWTGTSTAGWTVKAGSTTLAGSVTSKTWTFTTTADIASGTSISIAITDATRPASGTADFQGFASISVSKDSNTYLSWTNSASTTTTVTTATAKTQGASKASMWVFPDVAGSTDVYFGLSFTSTYLIPSGASIAIAGTFSDHSEVRNDLFTTHKYSSASVSSSTLTIVLSEDLEAGKTFELVFDMALDIPSTATSTNLSPVLVTVTCDDTSSTVAIQDTTSNAPKQYYSVSSAPTAKISSLEYDSVTSDAGFTSWYSFNLTLDTASDDEFWVHVDFSGDFNAIPGPTYELNDYAGALLIPAMDANGESVLCLASHWVVSCFFGEAVAEDGTVTLWLMIDNNQETGSVSVYITDNDYNLLYQPIYSSDTQSVDFENNLQNSIDLYFAVSESEEGNEVEFDLELQAFVDIEAKAGESLIAVFPYPFDLELSQGSSVECSLVYYNSDGDDESVDVILDDSCEVDGNMVIFTLPEDQIFTSANWTLFSIFGVETPSSGFERTAWNYEGEILDYSSGTFCILYEDSDDVVAGASFDNLNAAFTEFDQIGDYVRLVVNGGENIAVTPGTVSGPFIITSEDGEISAETITVQGAEDVDDDEEATIVLSDDGAYSVDYLNAEAEFYVGAQTGASFGMYYIRWEIEETTFDGEEAQYLKPRATVVEVSYENTYELVFDLEEIYVPPGFSSFPVTVSIDMTDRLVVPYSGVSVSFTPDDSSVTIEISPNPLVIDADWPENYFVISCDDCVSGSSYVVNVTVEGDDAEAFYAVKQISFLYESEYTEAAVIEVTLDNETPIGFDYSIDSDSRGIVTWAIVCDEVKLDYNYTYDVILEEAFLYGAEEGKTVEEYVDEILALYESAYEEETYADIAYWLFTYGSEVAVPGQSLVEVGDNLIWSFDFLVPGLTYTVYTFVDNLSGQDLVEDEQQATTSDMPPHAQLSIEFTTDDINVDDIAQIIALEAKWDLTLIELTSVRRRHMATSVSGYVYADPNSKSSAVDAVENNKDAIQTATGGTVSVTAISADTYEDGQFTDPSFDTDNGVILVFNYTVVEDGQIVCTIQNGSGIVEDTDNVYGNIASSGQTSEYYAFDVSAGETDSYTWNFTELGYEVSTYSVNCIACNAYPGDPSCSEVESTDYVYTATDDNGDSSSAASILAAVFAAYLLI